MADKLPHALPLPHPSEFSSPFWEATKQQKLLLQYDSACDKYQFFPRPVSIYSGRSSYLEWREASGTGTVYTFTVVYHAPTPAWSSRVPFIIASIDLVEGVRIMAHIVDCDVADVSIGLRVKLKWEPRGDFNVPVFTPETPRGVM